MGLPYHMAGGVMPQYSSYMLGADNSAAWQTGYSMGGSSQEIRRHLDGIDSK